MRRSETGQRAVVAIVASRGLGRWVDMCEPTRISGDGSNHIGKRLLVGITYLTHAGEFLRQEQFHGLIVEADEGGIVLERADTGARTLLPPELDEASPGEYRLRSTGEVVVNPDYVAKWTLTDPSPRQEAS